MGLAGQPAKSPHSAPESTWVGPVVGPHAKIGPPPRVGVAQPQTANFTGDTNMQIMMTLNRAKELFKLDHNGQLVWRTNYGRGRAGQRAGHNGRVKVDGYRFSVKGIVKVFTDNPYTADSIKVLKHEEVIEKFDWVKAEGLYDKYPWIPLECHERLLEACRLSAWEEDLAVRRYCDYDKSITAPPEFIEAYKELADQRFVGRATWVVEKKNA